MTRVCCRYRSQVVPRRRRRCATAGLARAQSTWSYIPNKDSTPFTGKKKGGSNGSPPDTGCEFMCCKTHGSDGNFQANSGGVAGWPSRISPMGTRSRRSCTIRGCLHKGLLPVGKFLGIRFRHSPEGRRSSAHWESLLVRIRCRHRPFGSAREGKVECGLRPS
jgi:hypothetical protein